MDREEENAWIRLTLYALTLFLMCIAANQTAELLKTLGIIEPRP